MRLLWNTQYYQQLLFNIGFCIDSLPFITPKDGTNKPGSFGGWIFDKDGFIEKHAKQTKQNIEDTKPYRDKIKYPNFKFYGIIQGRNFNEYKQWYDVIKDDYLDGYCCKAPNVNPITLAETCIFAIKNLDAPVHFLGIGNISRSIVLYYASRFFKHPISYDSSSYDIGTQYRNYVLPFMMGRKLRFVSDHHLTTEEKTVTKCTIDNERIIINISEDDNEICNRNDIVIFENANDICDCIACRTIGDQLGNMIRSNNPVLGSMISIHNLILNIRWANYVKTIVNYPEKLKEFVKYNFEPSLADKITKAFEMIDLAMERGHEYAFFKFKDVMQTNKVAKKQTNLFGFSKND